MRAVEQNLCTEYALITHTLRTKDSITRRRRKDSIARRRREDQQLAGSAGQLVGIWVNSGNARLLLADKLHPHPCVHTPSQRA